jgi:hypothetical protein
MYVKFAGSVVVALRRWMDAPEIYPEDEAAKKNYFDNIFIRHKPITEFMGEDLSQLTDEHIAGEKVFRLTRLHALQVRTWTIVCPSEKYFSLYIVYFSVSFIYCRTYKRLF